VLYAKTRAADSPTAGGDERNKKPGGEVANPHAGFLNINLVSSLREAVSRQLSAVSKKLMADG
jgi:hypothetical protein